MSWIRLAVAGVALCAGASAARAQGAPPAGAPSQGGPQAGPQGGGPGGMRGGRGMQMLFEGITLTDVQQKQVQDIAAKYRAQMQELRPNGMAGGPPDPSMRAKMDDMRTKQQTDIRAILTPDQRTVFDKNAAEMKKRRDQMQRPSPDKQD